MLHVNYMVSGYSCTRINRVCTIEALAEKGNLAFQQTLSAKSEIDAPSILKVMHEIW